MKHDFFDTNHSLENSIFISYLYWENSGMERDIEQRGKVTCLVVQDTC